MQAMGDSCPLSSPNPGGKRSSPVPPEPATHRVRCAQQRADRAGLEARRRDRDPRHSIEAPTKRRAVR